MREDRHCQFGEVFERQVVEAAGLAQPSRRVEVVPPKTGPVPDANGIHGQRIVASSCCIKWPLQLQRAHHGMELSQERQPRAVSGQSQQIGDRLFGRRERLPRGRQCGAGAMNRLPFREPD